MGSSSGNVSKIALWTGRVISALPVLLVLFSAGMKFAKPASFLEGWHKFGYSDDLILPIAITETACAIIYLIPQTAVLGAILLTGYLGGATATHTRAHDPAFFMPVLCGVLVWVGLFFRDRRIRALIPFRR
jgi:hypothetical protein